MRRSAEKYALLFAVSRFERMSQFTGGASPALRPVPQAGPGANRVLGTGLALLEQAPQDLRKLGDVFLNAWRELITHGVWAPLFFSHLGLAIQFLLHHVQTLLSFLKVRLVDAHAIHTVQRLNKILDRFLQVIDLIRNVGAVDFLHLLALRAAEHFGHFNEFRGQGDKKMASYRSGSNFSGYLHDSPLSLLAWETIFVAIYVILPSFACLELGLQSSFCRYLRDSPLVCLS